MKKVNVTKFKLALLDTNVKLMHNLKVRNFCLNVKKLQAISPVNLTISGLPSVFVILINVWLQICE